MQKETEKSAEERAGKELNTLIERYPVLSPLRDKIRSSYETLLSSIRNGGKILVCGNGGSSADSDHFVGELMKSFTARRPLPPAFRERLKSIDSVMGEKLAENLEGAIPAINLTTHASLSTACSNDRDATLCFSQQIVGYGEKGDILFAISTSGNSPGVVMAAITAKAKGMKTIALTGMRESRLMEFADITINVPETETYRIQELHLPVYHALALMLETSFWSEKR